MMNNKDMEAINSMNLRDVESALNLAYLNFDSVKPEFRTDLQHRISYLQSQRLKLSLRNSCRRIKKAN